MFIYLFDIALHPIGLHFRHIGVDDTMGNDEKEMMTQP